jgi:hypothetical protein
METTMALGRGGKTTPALRLSVLLVSMFALVGGLFSPGVFLTQGGAAWAQSAECQQLRAALAAPVSIDPGAAAGARRARAELDRAMAQAHAMGCDNQQFLFFGSPPPPQCGGLKARIEALKGQFDAYSARSSGDSPQRRALRARYDANCGAAPRERNFFETLFGNFGEERRPEDGVVADQLPEQPEGGGNGAIGGSQALCVRSCDGGFFPLNFSARSASTDDLQQMCQALCPNTPVQLFTRNPRSDISTALGADGTAYQDLPNALKYTKAFDPACACKPPNQSWVEALAHAEQVLDQMGGAKASDTVVTEQQSRDMALPTPPKPGKATDRKLAPTPVSAPVAAPAAPSPEKKVIESAAPDGSPRQVRVVGPNF